MRLKSSIDVNASITGAVTSSVTFASRQSKYMFVSSQPPRTSQWKCMGVSSQSPRTSQPKYMVVSSQSPKSSQPSNHVTTADNVKMPSKMSDTILEELRLVVVSELSHRVKTLRL